MREPLYLAGGRRCALRASEWLDDWYVGTSPRNGDDASVEGPWSDWVTLAEAILTEDARRAAAGADDSPEGDKAT